MAKGLKAGAVVKALARKAVGISRAKHLLGSQWETGFLRGTIVGSVGSGRSRKWIVSWDRGGENSQLSSRSLTVDTENFIAGNGNVTADSQSESESDSERSSSSDDEEGDNDNNLSENQSSENNGAIAATSFASGNVVVAHDVQWTRVESVSRDVRQQRNNNARLMWHDSLPVTTKTEFDFFMLMFPTQCLGRILSATEAAWPAGSRTMDKFEFFKTIGLMLAMTVHVLPARRMYWETEDGLFPAAAFGVRYGMSRRRFEDILHYLRLDDKNLSAATPTDQWFPIRGFVDSFNRNMETNFHAGEKLCVDESMCSWRGRGDFAGGMPHVTKIARKPKGVGLEIKDVCDVKTNILLRLEIVEEKEAMSAKEFASEFGAGTSVCLRLCKPWLGSDRIVCGDSAFASVKTAVALQKRGLHFTGLVKTAHRKFPKQFLDQVQIADRGGFVTLTAEVDGVPLLAHTWNDRKRKHFVSTCGTTNEAEPCRKKRYRVSRDGIVETIYKEVKRQQLVQLYFDGAPSVDIHNHYRQGGLALEQVWGTQLWWHRVFSTLLGIIETNSFLAYRHFKPDSGDVTHRQFVVTLSKALINNPYAVHGRQYSGRRSSTEEAYSADGDGDVPVEGVAPSETHQLLQLSSAAKYASRGKGRALLACRVCRHLRKEKKLASYYYRQCSSPATDYFFALCGPQSQRGTACYLWHMHNRID